MDCTNAFLSGTTFSTQQVCLHPFGDQISKAAWEALYEADGSITRRYLEKARVSVIEEGFVLWGKEVTCPTVVVNYNRKSDIVIVFSNEDFLIDVIRNEARKAGVLPSWLHRHTFYDCNDSSGVVVARKDSLKLVKWLLGDHTNDRAVREKLQDIKKEEGKEFELGDTEELFGDKIRLISSSADTKAITYRGEPLGQMVFGEEMFISSTNPLYIAALKYEAQAAGVWPEAAKKCYVTVDGENLSCLVIPKEDADSFLFWQMNFCGGKKHSSLGGMFGLGWL